MLDLVTDAVLRALGLSLAMAWQIVWRLGLGAACSSCSHATVALTCSLFRKGRPGRCRCNRANQPAC